MALPYFFVESLSASTLVLGEDTSKHMIGVLRMQKNEEVLLTDGKGTRARSRIVDDNRKKCIVEIVSSEKEEAPKRKTGIAISLTKNSSRFEWFLEKATEIGISEIIPLICERTEKQKFRADRMQNIMVSAMLQSQQCRLPRLTEPVPYKKMIDESWSRKFIAHCLPDEKKELRSLLDYSSDAIILIGPEGDFSNEEIDWALNRGFIAVALGEKRLRTETAGIVAAAILNIP